MLLIVLTYIALYQTPLQGFFTMLIYAVGPSIPLIVISSVGGAPGKKNQGYGTGERGSF